MNTEPSDSKPLETAPVLGQGVDVRRTLQTAGGTLSYRAVADWMVLREDDAPIASLFYTAYFLESDEDRPITFVFNGGPGASSVYLHLGLVGPRRVPFAADGSIVGSPIRLEDNPDTWLRFTDVVCVDPVGTGFSRSHEPKKDDEKQPSRFWEVKRDLDALGELIRRVLTKEKRWESPVVLAGESYGGFRVARMAKTLQEDHGVPIHTAISISPGIELSSLLDSDYNLDHWVELFPSLAATAHAHGKAGRGASAAEHRASAEAFAVEEWVCFLAQGTHMAPERRAEICARAARLIGMDAALLERCHGRLRRDQFCRQLLVDEQRFIGRYDGKVSNVDPFPDRTSFEGPDVTLGGLSPTFQVGINALLRQDLGVETELLYDQLNIEANESWKDEDQKHFISLIGKSMDALRYGMALNPHMQVLISHGYHDLVTPYSAAERLVRQLKLAPGQRPVLLEHFEGGHMFYAHADSRRAFTATVERLL